MTTRSYLNGPVDAALTRMAADAYGVSPEQVTPEFLAEREIDEASERRTIEARLRAKFQRWARAQPEAL
jgi:hypothetical protein